MFIVIEEEQSQRIFKIIFNNKIFCLYFQTLVLCFRLHFTKNSTIINTAGATVRQLVSLVFERVILEDEALSKLENPPQPRVVNLEDLKCPNGVAPKGLLPCAADAYLLFQVRNGPGNINNNNHLVHFSGLGATCERGSTILVTWYD